MATLEPAPALQGTPNADRTKLISDQLGRLIHLYEHHFDLLLKAVAGLLAVLAFVGSSLVNHQTSVGMRIVLAALMSLTSLFGLIGVIISKRWVVSLRRRVHNLCEELQIEDPPIHAEEVLTLLLFVCITLLVGGIACTLAVWQRWL
jgi:hypothetical protein